MLDKILTVAVFVVFCFCLFMGMVQIPLIYYGQFEFAEIAFNSFDFGLNVIAPFLAIVVVPRLVYCIYLSGNTPTK